MDEVGEKHFCFFLAWHGRKNILENPGDNYHFTHRGQSTKNRGGPGAAVKAAYSESRKSRVRAPLWFKETKCFFPYHLNIKYCGDRDVACSASDHQGPNFASCVQRAVSSHSSHHHTLAQISSDFKLHVYNTPFDLPKIYKWIIKIFLHVKLCLAIVTDTSWGRKFFSSIGYFSQSY